LTWRAKISVGLPLGLLFVGLVVAVDVWLLNRLINNSIGAQQIGLATFVMGLVFLLSVPLLIFLVYQTLSLVTLRYFLDRNGLVVRWIGTQQIIPIRDIARIMSGRTLGDAVVQRSGLRWPGHERGQGLVPGIGRTRFLATRPLTAQRIHVTPGQAFGISPRDPEVFLHAFEARRELGPNRLLEQEVRHAPFYAWSLWTDQTAWILIGTALVINLALFGYLSVRLAGLDLQLPLHFNSQGLADRIGTKMELFALPIIGLIILGTNLVLGLILYRRERVGSYLLWGGAAAAQILFWLAILSIVP
jgi:hypothetical protein